MQGARVVRVVAGTLAAIAFIAGFGNLLPYEDFDHNESAVHLAVDAHMYKTRTPPLRFIVTATSLNPVDRRIQATLTLVPQARDRTPLLVDANGKSVEQAGVLRPEFAEAKLKVVLRNSFFGETTVLYALATVVDPLGSEDALSVTASIPADVDPTQFPNDSYSLGLTVTVFLPPGVDAASPEWAGGVVPVGARTDVSAAFGIALDDRLGRWDLDTEAIVSSGIGANITAELSRGWAYWAFIYSVSLMPAVIGLSFFVRTRRRGAGDTSAAMELAAALLALIALRQVFVPTDIVGLTRLDFVLGVQLLAVCWLMAVTYVAEPPVSPPPVPKPVVRRRRLVPRPPDGAVRRIT